MEKICRLCGAVKDIDDFYVNDQMKLGRTNECKRCSIDLARRRYSSDPAHYRKLYVDRRDRKRALMAATGCSDCGELKPILLRSTKLGVLCANCHRKRRVSVIPTGIILRGKNRREAIIKLQLGAIKSTTGCATCREKDHRCLDFHHIDPKTKIRAVSGMARYTISFALEEAAKCIVLCANCHWEVEYEKISKKF